MAFDGDVAVVGGAVASHSVEKAGAVWVFRRSTAGWTIEAALAAPHVQAGAQFGGAVDVRGNVMAVGAPGYDAGPDRPDTGVVYLYVYGADGLWEHTATLTRESPRSGDRFGSALALLDRALAVGVPEATPAVFDTRQSAGLVEIYALAPTGPNHVATLTDPAMRQNDGFG